MEGSSNKTSMGGRNCWRLNLLDRQVVLECIEAGIKQKLIAENYGISRGYIAMLKMRYGGLATS